MTHTDVMKHTDTQATLTATDRAAIVDRLAALKQEFPDHFRKPPILAVYKRTEGESRATFEMAFDTTGDNAIDETGAIALATLTQGDSARYACSRFDTLAHVPTHITITGGAGL